MTQNYIERYWRDATPEDAIKEPPMVARFKDFVCHDWEISKLLGFTRAAEYCPPWFSESGEAFDKCQVYDAPDPGEGWRLIDPANEKWQEGDEIYDRSTGTWRKRLTPFQHWALSANRRRIEPTVTYVPFTWEDRDQLRGRWVARDNQELHLVNLDNSGGFCANGVDVKSLCKYWHFLDTGKPVGKEVTQ